MEDMFGLPLALRTRNRGGVIDGIPSQATLNSAVESNSFNFSYQDQVLDAVHGTPVNDHARIFDAMNFSSSSCVDALGFHEQFMAGRGSTQESMDNLALSASPGYPLDFRGYSCIDDSSCNNGSPFMISSDGGFGGGLGSMNTKWDLEKTQIRGGFQSCSLVGCMDPSGLTPLNGGNVGPDYPYASSRASNELCLSLATAQTAVVSGTNVPDQSSEVGTSGGIATPSCINANGLSSEQGSSGCNWLSHGFSSQAAIRGSQLISGSRYLHAVQEILAQIAGYSLERLEQTNCSTGVRTRGNALLCKHQTITGFPPIGTDEMQGVGSNFESHVEPALQKRAAEAKNAQLLALLQAVDDRYNQCVDEIHTVISAFHAATELDPQLHARFALHTISALYRNLREAISNQILSIGATLENCSSSGKEGSSQNLFIKEQWAIQQQKKKEHQLWRPQRGLPDKSVSVLRAWMFENFLHPYPKDAEKHILAVKSGLTRGQVSNWFINARVRLWKPMIEEMYKEMNRRKSRKNDQGIEKQQINLINQGFFKD